MSNNSMLHDDIINNAGILSSRIVYDIVHHNKQKLWYIFGAMCDRMFYATFNKGDRIISGAVGFTDYNIAVSYLNRNLNKKVLLKQFGPKLTLIRMSLNDLYDMLDVPNINNFDIVLVNPSYSFFVPIMLRKFVNQNDSDELDSDTLDHDYISLIYNKYDREYVISDSDDYIGLISSI